MVKDIEEGCRTPKRSACRIPAAMVCPPPPKKKSAAYTARQRVPPKNGYFVPPDLELIFRQELSHLEQDSLNTLTKQNELTKLSHVGIIIDEYSGAQEELWS
ncbi:hypothetical protein JHK87_038973 [Glycine soja]|nr:hypothetical protein JHK87_038973 [Glycine soja]